MRLVNHENLKFLIKQHYKSRIALFIWGAPGIGKSDTVRQSVQEMANSFGLEYNEAINKIDDEKVFSLIDVRMSQMDATDIRGLPKIENGVTIWSAPDWLPKNPKAKGVLFLDELNQAPPLVQSACFQLIYNRRIGNYQLPDGYSVVAAGNRAEDRANVFEMSTPLAGRMSHFQLANPNELEGMYEEWYKWAMTKGRIDERIIGFLHFKPTFLFKLDVKLKEKAQPTPRTWEFASRLIEGEEDINRIELLTAGSVGEEASHIFGSWLRASQKISLQDLLKNPQKVKEISDPGLLYSVCVELSAAYKNNPNVFDSAIEVLKLVEPEYVIMTLRLMSREKGFTIRMQKHADFVGRFGKFLFD